MSTTGQPSSYTAFLLRCWLEGSAWRYSLEEIGTNDRRAFATLDELFSFMLARSVLPGDVEGLPSVEADRRNRTVRPAR